MPESSGEPLALGIDIGGTNVKIGAVDRERRVLASRAAPTEVNAPAEHALDRIVHAIDQLLADAAIARSDVAGIGVGCPGPLSPSRGLVIGPGNLPTWRNLELTRLLGERTGLPVTLDNDANMAAWGEYWAGSGRGVRDMVMFTLGTGIGGGVIVDGRLLHGHYENAAELGHLIVQPGGRLCTCGQRGCLEQYASARFTAERAAEAVRSGRPSRLQEALAGRGTIVCEDVVEAVRQGDALACEIWDETCEYLAIACVDVQHAFNPARIVLAGGMIAAGDLLLDRVRQAVKRLTWKLTDDRPDIVPAALGNNAGLVGAAGRLFEYLASKP